MQYNYMRDFGGSVYMGYGNVAVYQPSTAVRVVYVEPAKPVRDAYLDKVLGLCLTAKNEQERSLFAKLFVKRWATLSGIPPKQLEEGEGIVWCNRGDLIQEERD